MQANTLNFKKSLQYLFIFVTLTTVQAQSGLDSLYTIWQDATQKDSLRIKAMEDFIWNGYLTSQPDSALVYIDELFEFSESRDHYEGMARASLLKGQVYYIKSDYDQAVESLSKSSEYSDLAKDRMGYAAAKGSIAMIYQIQDDYVAALKYHKEALSIFEELNNPYNMGVALNNIGTLYYNKGQYDKALDYFSQSLEQVGDEYPDLGRSIVNIGSIYSDLGDHEKALSYHLQGLKLNEALNDQLFYASCLSFVGGEYRYLQQYDSALVYLNRSLDISESLGNSGSSGAALLKLGQLYIDLKDYLKARDALERSVEMHLSIGDGTSAVVAMIPMGTVNFKLGEYSNSVSVCRRALEQAEQLQLIAEQELACKCLYKAYKALGNSQKALEYHERVLVLNDSSKILEMDKKLQQLEFAKQLAEDSLMQVEKDLQVEMVHQAELRDKDRNRNVAIGAGIFFLVLSGGFYSRWRYVKKSKQIIEKEKDRSENLLLNILPSEIAEELKQKGSVDAQDFEQVSVLFTDFKGFTSRSEKLTAKELVREINQCFKAFDHICEKFRIEKIKTIGDAYMAGGGLPVPSNDAVKNTVLAALEMQTFMTQRATEKMSSNEIPFEMRVGIHTGPVVAGIVGVKKFQYDIWGDTVNTASRVESSGAVGKVNISRATYDIIKDDPEFDFEARGKIKTKGKGELEMFFVSLA